MSSHTAEPTETGGDEPDPGELTTNLTLPWAAPSFVSLKGIVHEPTAKPAMSPETRDALLAAITKARGWIEDLKHGRVATLAEIADREGVGERHVALAPLAFIAPISPSRPLPRRSPIHGHSKNSASQQRDLKLNDLKVWVQIRPHNRSRRVSRRGGRLRVSCSTN